MAENATRDITAFLRERVVPPGGSRYGLVVGIEQYRDARLNLRCAAADAKAIFDLMTDPDCGMFPKDNVRLLLNEEATREGIWRALSALRRSAGENDTVWVYYAGHAAPEESNIYWVTYDADVDDLYGTGLSNDQISKVLGDIRAKRLLVLLDCCHAAATAAQKNPTRAVLTVDDIFSCYKGHGRITLSSSDGKEKSVELGDVGHGAFTYFLEQGLRGEADADGDGVVTADELWQYLRRKVTAASKKAGNRQTPVLIGEMTHDLALTLNPLASSRKRQISDAIVALIGLGKDRLTTEEAELCLALLRRGPHGAAQADLFAEFDSLLSGQIRTATFKRLIQATRYEKPATPPYVPPPENEAGQSGSIQPGTDRALMACILDGKKIKAIKRRREMTGEGLKAAKDYVERLAEVLDQPGDSCDEVRKTSSIAGQKKMPSMPIAATTIPKKRAPKKRAKTVKCGHCQGTGMCRNDEASKLRGNKRIACKVCWCNAGSPSDWRQPITCSVCKGTGGRSLKPPVRECAHCCGKGSCLNDTASFLRGRAAIPCIPCWKAAGSPGDVKRVVPCQICGGIGFVSEAVES